MALVASRLSNDIDRVAIFPGEGRAVEGFGALGIRTVVIPATRRLDVFDRELLRLDPAGVVAVGVSLLVYNLRLAVHLIKHRPDIVHCNDARSLLMMGLAAKLLRVPVVWHLRGRNVLEDRPVLNRFAHALASEVVLVADALRSSISPNISSRTIYNGIDRQSAEDQADTGRALAKLLLSRDFDPSNTLCILTASSLVPYKGLHHLVRALSILFESEPDTRSRIAWIALGDTGGDPTRERYLQTLRRDADELNVSRNIVFAGWQPQPQPWVQAAEIVVLPTILEERFTFSDGIETRVRCDEGFPRTVLEAMAAGKPVIATRVAGVPEQVTDGKTGILVPPSDPRALSEALQRLIGTPSLRAVLGSAARAEVAHFSLERTIAETERLYAEMTGFPDSRPRILHVVNKAVPSSDYRVQFALRSKRFLSLLGLPGRPAALPESQFVRTRLRESVQPIDPLNLLHLWYVLHSWRRRIDYVHFYSTKLVLAGPILARLSGLSALITMTGFGRLFSEDRLHYRPLRMIYRTAFRVSGQLSTAVLFQNSVDMQTASDWHPRLAHKMSVVGSAVESLATKPPDFSQSPLRVILVARIMPAKGIEDFLAVAAALPQDQFSFILAGPGSSGYASLLERVREAHAAGTITYLGEVPPEGMGHVYEQGHILFLPSYGEGMSRVLLEAGTAGLFPVVYRIPGNVDVVADDCGCLIDAGDVEAAISALQYLAQERHLLEEKAATFKSFIEERYGMDAFIQRMDDFMTGLWMRTPARRRFTHDRTSV